jgi:adenylylsulfate kinase
VTRDDTLKAGSVIWFTGLPCSGKSTLARLLHEYLKAKGVPSEIFDGDIVRQRLAKGLGFSKEDRMENVRRIAYVAHLLARHGVVAIVAAISPYQEARDEIRKEFENYVEVFVDCPLEVCQARDVKGMYKKARAGEIQHFTGVSDPYEVPTSPDLVLKTSLEPQAESLSKILSFLSERGLIF